MHFMTVQIIHMVTGFDPQEHTIVYTDLCSYIYDCTDVGYDTCTITYSQTVSHNCFYYTSKPECAIPDDNIHKHNSIQAPGMCIFFALLYMLQNHHSTSHVLREHNPHGHRL